MTFLFALLFSLSTPCETEDMMNCYWSAEEHGNGSGESFIDVHGTAYYSVDELINAS